METKTKLTYATHNRHIQQLDYTIQT
jgi:hypothetical protein